jgi:hypothetical protein
MGNRDKKSKTEASGLARVALPLIFTELFS